MGGRKYNFNQDYFNNIDSAIKAYILGFIGADGNNNREGFRIEIHKKDLDILQKIQKEIGECNLSVKERKVGLYYYSKKMSDRLTELGVIPAKTHFFDFIETDFDRDFIRGYFDGDGSISIDRKRYNRAQITFTGNSLLINKIKKIIDLKFNLSGYLYTRHKETENIITLTYCGSPSCSRILNWMYEDSDIYLDRKFKLYEEIFKRQQSKEADKIAKKLLKKQILDKKLKDIQDEKDRIISFLDEGYSIRQLKLQYGIDKRKTRKVIEEYSYPYGTRRRMFAVDLRARENNR